ncbi:hypothetical protein NERG_02625 [Nematocida ausubeli]|uniref:Uncharacterized protein n=1 Tax=Nematocida ausubeli (strain ATCC PRA-371 / ERTm2) TaxID=1913371 RepID=H8ZGA4_NEMA1|nr:hypothetical protein NERG_02625 [Nematocida ausubeli]
MAKLAKGYLLKGILSERRRLAPRHSTVRGKQQVNIHVIPMGALTLLCLRLLGKCPNSEIERTLLRVEQNYRQKEPDTLRHSRERAKYKRAQVQKVLGECEAMAKWN